MNQHLERLDDLAPLLQQPAHALIDRCQQELGRSLLVVYTWRSVQEQAVLYQMGRAVNPTTGVLEVKNAALVVTNAKPGTTAHNVVSKSGAKAAMALDVIPLQPDGSADWDPGQAFWTSLYAMAWQCGLDPLGDQVGAYLKSDKGHHEEPGWKLKLDGLGLMLPVSSTDV